METSCKASNKRTIEGEDFCTSLLTEMQLYLNDNYSLEIELEVSEQFVNCRFKNDNAILDFIIFEFKTPTYIDYTLLRILQFTYKCEALLSKFPDRKVILYYSFESYQKPSKIIINGPPVMLVRR